MHAAIYITLTILVTPWLHAEEPAKLPDEPLDKPAAQVSTKELIQHLLAQDLGTRSFPFSDVVSAATGKQVIPMSKASPIHQAVITAISNAANDALKTLNRSDSPIRELSRINEASRFFEDHFLKHLNIQPNITCSIPSNQQGKLQRSGYPDLLITHTSTTNTADPLTPEPVVTHFYLDPKLYEQKSRSSSLRTFYYEPRTRTNKILHDATHLLIGISHDGNDGAWTFTGWEIVDLSSFNVRLKAEFQASNKDIYRPHNVIGSSATK